jgi:hypothetical protein
MRNEEGITFFSHSLFPSRRLMWALYIPTGVLPIHFYHVKNVKESREDGTLFPFSFE